MSEGAEVKLKLKSSYWAQRADSGQLTSDADADDSDPKRERERLERRELCRMMRTSARLWLWRRWSDAVFERFTSSSWLRVSGERLRLRMKFAERRFPGPLRSRIRFLVATFGSCCSTGAESRSDADNREVTRRNETRRDASDHKQTAATLRAYSTDMNDVTSH